MAPLRRVATVLHALLSGTGNATEQDPRPVLELVSWRVNAINPCAYAFITRSRSKVQTQHRRNTRATVCNFHIQLQITANICGSSNPTQPVFLSDFHNHPKRIPEKKRNHDQILLRLLAALLLLSTRPLSLDVSIRGVGAAKNI
ncbi:hypothetical protein BDN72DRAFT_838801 [Pluteus cervinus]|uniref:Uncharacterized protein n=1 Tax=Pluteus cervinus TaxID=181527 RepID=A0ACD3AZ25_9AGAR|nr:hypothetical protein BDN72DRAFT_838801 [Pluteus cervinus]